MSTDREIYSLAERALARIQELEAKLGDHGDVREEKLAIVGIGCRLPGAKSPQQYWDLVASGKVTVSPVPTTRWTASDVLRLGATAHEASCVGFGGFVSDPELFDPEFFGISPREALTLDPQQRLLMEVAWEALEDAGLSGSRLSRHLVGTFVGITGVDYSLEVFGKKPGGRFPYLATGTAHSVASGRLAYIWGLQGPAVSFDTACSSSLTALHYARRSLCAGDCDIALVGGVNSLLLPNVSLHFARAGMLSPRGRCSAFDASADGFVRSEGCGMVVLKRLQNAIDSGDRIYATIVGSATNQDGRTSGITVPNGKAQEAAITKALNSAAMNPERISYVECHGTGTRLGDPIEAAALARIHKGRGQSLKIGSVKANIGHLEAASGIAGLIKVALALSNRALPPQVNFDAPNPLINWKRAPLEVNTALCSFRDQVSIVAGVSSFGFSGTNVHVVLESYDPPKAAATAALLPVIVTTSGRTKAALDANVERLVTHLSATPAIDLGALSMSSTQRRAHFKWRSAAIGSSVQEIIDGLAGCAYREPGDNKRLSVVFLIDEGETSIHEDILTRFPYITSRIETWCSKLEPGCGEISWMRSGANRAALVDFLVRIGLAPALVVGIGQSGSLAYQLAKEYSKRNVVAKEALIASQPSSRPVRAFSLNNKASGMVSQTTEVGLPSSHSAVDALREQTWDVVIYLGTSLTCMERNDALSGGIERAANQVTPISTEAILRCAMLCYELGAMIDWDHVTSKHLLRTVLLPSYAFQHRNLLQRFPRAYQTDFQQSDTGTASGDVRVHRIDQWGVHGLLAPTTQSESRGVAVTNSCESLLLELSNGLSSSGPPSESTPDDPSSAENHRRAVIELRQTAGGEKADVRSMIHLMQLLVERSSLHHVLAINEHRSGGPSSASVAAGIARVLSFEHPELTWSFLDDRDGSAMSVATTLASHGLPAVTEWMSGIARANYIVERLRIERDNKTDRRSETIQIVSQENELSAELANVLRLEGATVIPLTWEEFQRSQPQKNITGVFLIAPRTQRGLMMSIDPDLFADTVDSWGATFNKALHDFADIGPEYVCLCRGSESLFGWPGRLLDCTLGELAMRHLKRGHWPVTRLLCVDLFGVVDRNDATGEVQRLQEHGFDATSPATAARYLTHLSTLQGHYYLGRGNRRHLLDRPVCTDRLAAIASGREAKPRTASDDDQLTNPSGDSSSSLSRLLAGTLGLAVDELNPETPLLDLGLDSLIALEFREKVFATIGVTLKVQDLLSGKGLREIEEGLREQ